MENTIAIAFGFGFGMPILSTVIGLAVAGYIRHQNKGD